MKTKIKVPWTYQLNSNWRLPSGIACQGTHVITETRGRASRRFEVQVADPRSPWTGFRGWIDADKLQDYDCAPTSEQE